MPPRVILSKAKDLISKNRKLRAKPEAFNNTNH